MPIAINFQNVSFSYSAKIQLFKDLNLKLSDDKTVIITGENGTGKSTLASLAAGLLKPVTGTIKYTHNEIKLKKSSLILKEMAYLNQKTEENIICPTPADELQLWLKSKHTDRCKESVMIADVLDEWRLGHILNVPVWDLSSGELKSLALAGICLNPHKYWIMDEPLVSLDFNRKSLLLEKIAAKQTISRGMLIITHDPGVWENIADEEYLLLADGRLTKQ